MNAMHDMILMDWNSSSHRYLCLLSICYVGKLTPNQRLAVTFVLSQQNILTKAIAKVEHQLASVKEAGISGLITSRKQYPEK